MQWFNRGKMLFALAFCSLFALPVQAHKITVQSSAGGTPTSYEIDDGATVHLIATADAGSHFVQWADGNTDNPRDITVIGDATYTAVFEADGGGTLPTKCTATIYAGDCNNPFIGEFNTGSQLSINAVPKEGYKFKRWTDGNTANPRNITITSDITLYAEYEPFPGATSLYTVSVQAEGCSNVIEGRYPSGTSLTLMAQPNIAIGGLFAHWEDNSTTPTRLVSVSTDAIHTATFALPPESIIVPDGTNLDICSSGLTTVKKVVVEPGGELSVNSSCIQIDTLIIVADGFRSGQVYHTGDITANHIFLEYILEYQATTASPDKWYAFAVPFEVDLATGISRTCDDKTLVSGTDFLVMEFDGMKRAQTSKGWKAKQTGTLLPGQSYLIGIDGTCNNWRFERMANKPYEGDMNGVPFNGNPASNAKNTGWNGLGNTQLRYTSIADLANAGLQYVLTYDNRYSNYVTHLISDIDLFVGQPFFIQASANGSFNFQTVSQNTTNNVPARAAKRQQPLMHFTLTNEKGDVGTDHLYLTLHDDATDTYTIGRDLARLSDECTTAAQLWCNTFDGTELTAHGLTATATETIVPLGLYVPKKGEYLLELNTRAMEEYNVELLYQGAFMALLSDRQPVTLTLAKGTTNDYTLRLRRKVTTDVENAAVKLGGCQKMFIDGHLYILQGDHIYDAQGKRVK